jgi:hypothetical protein
VKPEANFVHWKTIISQNCNRQLVSFDSRGARKKKVSTMGAYISIINDTPDEWTCKVGPDEAALKTLTVVGIIMGTCLLKQVAVSFDQRTARGS